MCVISVWMKYGCMMVRYLLNMVGLLICRWFLVVMCIWLLMFVSCRLFVRNGVL